MNKAQAQAKKNKRVGPAHKHTPRILSRGDMSCDKVTRVTVVC